MLALVSTFAFQSQQSHLATHRYSNDVRNPYIYVPSSKDLFKFEDFTTKLLNIKGWPKNEIISVLGSSYWPLPWYLRHFSKVGYWESSPFPTDLEKHPLVITCPSATEPIMKRLEHSHQFLFYGLRNEFPMVCFIRNDLWSQWQ
jgi:predicted membrane-bound mannosyltransferase